MAKRLQAMGTTGYETVVGQDGWIGNVRLVDHRLTQPIGWRKPRRVFVCSMSDLFHPNVPTEWIDEVFATIYLAAEQGHVFQVLTKRTERMGEYIAGMLSLPVGSERDRRLFDPWRAVYGSQRGQRPALPCKNVWMGATVETADYAGRIDDLRALPAAVRFLSLEPLLGPMTNLDLAGIDWVICGGESGPGARPMHPDWPRSVRDQCADADVPFFFKQWGEWAWRHERKEDRVHQARRNRWGMIRVGKKVAGRLLDGVLHDDYPADLEGGRE
jgi:protein gp37